MIPGDSLRAVLDSVFAAPAYRWSEQPDPLRWLREWLGRIVEWLLALRVEHPVGFKLVVAAAGVVFVAILAHAGVILWRTVRRADAADETVRAAARPEVRDAEWHFRHADEAARAGRYREALRLIVGGVIVHLDERGVLNRRAGTTPAEYARAARLTGDDRERLTDLVRALYRHVYGGVPCGAEDYARWRGLARGAWREAAG
ncbi:MAG TPA: DUF4129 domain-containing protein [Gemmatimonadales bacterium]|nr:DUF4129 domain-containing protein [Gemmatimonadales bacterium]